MRGRSSIIRTLTVAAASAALLVTTACGTGAPPITGGGTGQGGEPSSPPPTRTIDYPTEPTEIVISLGQITIAGDGRVFRLDLSPTAEEDPEPAPEGAENEADADGPEASSAAIATTGTPGPGRLAAAPARIGAGRPIATVDVRPPTPHPFTVAQITPAGMDALLAEADRLGLLGTNTEPDPHDMLPTMLTIRVTSGAYRHVASGLSNYDNAQVRQFDAIIQDLEGFLGEEIGPTESYVPHAWQLSRTFTQPDEPIRPWPLEQEPSAGECAVLPSEPDRDTGTGGYDSDGRIMGAFPALPWECLEESTAEPTGGNTSSGLFDHPTDADHLLIQTGWVTVTGDGTIYRYADSGQGTDDSTATDSTANDSDSGPDEPGDAVQVITAPPPLEVAQISPAGLEALLSEAERLGLLSGDYVLAPSDPDYGTVVIDLGSRQHTHALLYGDDQPAGIAAVTFDQVLRDPAAVLGS